MNQAHWHLAINHFPIIGVIIGTFILYIGLLRKYPAVQKVALWLFVVVAVAAIPALLTGEGAEEIVENIAGVQKSALEQHEETATLTFWIIILNGVLSLIVLYFQNLKQSIRKPIIYLMVITAAASCVLSLLTANSGGNIRHTEFSVRTASNIIHQHYYLQTI